MPVVVELDRADVWVAGVEKGMERAVVLGLRSAALRGVQEIVARIIPSRSPMPVDRAVYRAGWRALFLPNGADIENLEPVAILIEEGVRAANVKPGRAMIKALAAWAIRKRIATAEDAEGIAWAIAKTMQKRGIFGRGMGLGILKELVEHHLEGFVQEEVARELEKVR